MMKPNVLAEELEAAGEPVVVEEEEVGLCWHKGRIIPQTRRDKAFEAWLLICHEDHEHHEALVCIDGKWCLQSKDRKEFMKHKLFPYDYRLEMGEFDEEEEDYY